MFIILSTGLCNCFNVVPPKISVKCVRFKELQLTYKTGRCRVLFVNKGLLPQKAFRSIYVFYLK